MPYFAHISQLGPVKHDTVPVSIGMLEAIHEPMPIGQAHCISRNAQGLGVWKLQVGKQQLPGRWIILDREFRPAQ
jgi:hypothetical protein